MEINIYKADNGSNIVLSGCAQCPGQQPQSKFPPQGEPEDFPKPPKRVKPRIVGYLWLRKALYGFYSLALKCYKTDWLTQKGKKWH